MLLRDDASLPASGLAFDGSPDAFACKKPRAMSPPTADPRIIVLISDRYRADFLKDAPELWRRRKTHGSIRVQEGDPGRRLRFEPSVLGRVICVREAASHRDARASDFQPTHYRRK